MSDPFDVHAELTRLVDRWCERRELRALRILLPAWPPGMGLTDELADLLEALRHLRATLRDHLPKDEYDLVNRAVAEVSKMVHRK